MDPTPDQTRKIFKMLDREHLIRSQIARESGPLNYLLELKGFSLHLEEGEQRLDAALGAVQKAASERGLARAFTEIRFIYFALISIHLSLENFLFEGAC